MPRLSEASFQRNRLLQTRRNQMSNPERKRRQIASLRERSFIGWDGEGYTDTSGHHHYVLLGNSEDTCLTGEDLPTATCLNSLLEARERYPTAYHVGFAFDYDVNMILRDLETPQLATLASTGQTRWHGYTITHIPHKIFSVKSGSTTFTLDDVFSWFRCSYVQALRKYGVGSAEQIARVTEGKERRSDFTLANLEYIRSYWEQEISLFPPLMDKLREVVYDAGFHVTRWYGPTVLSKWGMREHKSSRAQIRGSDSTRPSQIRAASRFRRGTVSNLARRTVHRTGVHGRRKLCICLRRHTSPFPVTG